MKRIELFIGFALFLSAMMAQGKSQDKGGGKRKGKSEQHQEGNKE